MSQGRIIQYKCNKCGNTQDRSEIIGIKYEQLKCCSENMVRNWGCSVNMGGMKHAYVNNK